MPFWYFFPISNLSEDVLDDSRLVQLIEYLSKERSAVDEGTPIALVETRRAVLKLKANGKGILKKTFFEPGTHIKIGDPIATIAADGEDIPCGKDYSVAEVITRK
jgi:pyruvate/2-oxoglutarate dehydrogenase complex dihydrolipoamide acyltransferase (E2) component